jgi:hypothetical protein
MSAEVKIDRLARALPTSGEGADETKGLIAVKMDTNGITDCVRVIPAMLDTAHPCGHTSRTRTPVDS